MSPFCLLVSLAGVAVSAGTATAGTETSPRTAPLARQSSATTSDLFRSGVELSRAALVEAVLERNPSLEAARYAIAASEQLRSQATALDDLDVSYAFAPSSVLSSDTRYGQVIALRQRFPFPGRLRAQGGIADAGTEVTRQHYERERLALATRTSALFDDYYLVLRAHEINEDHLRLLESFQAVATARYAAGLAAQQDPIQAEVEVVHLLHRRAVLETQQQIIVAQINALLHRSPAEELPAPSRALEPPPQLARTSEELEELALQSRPELKAIEASIAGHQFELRLRGLESRPDFEASASFNSMWAQSDHRWMFGVGVNIPLSRKRLRAGIAEAEATIASVESRRAALVDRIRSEVVQAAHRLELAHHVISLYSSRILPAARDQLSAARTGFETGSNTFLAVIAAEKNLRNAELAALEALADAHRRHVELLASLGLVPGDSTDSLFSLNSLNEAKGGSR